MLWALLSTRLSTHWETWEIKSHLKNSKQCHYSWILGAIIKLWSGARIKVYVSINKRKFPRCSIGGTLMLLIHLFILIPDKFKAVLPKWNKDEIVYLFYTWYHLGLPWMFRKLEAGIKSVWAYLVAQMVKNLPAMQETRVQSLRWEDLQGEDPWRRNWQPTPLLLPGVFHGQKSLAGYSSWDHNQTWLSLSLTYSFSFPPNFSTF